MQWYATLKLVHILSSTLLLGTGLGIAWFLQAAYRSGNDAVFRAIATMVVRADWRFTLPAVIVQLVSGLWLTLLAGISPRSAWFVSVITLFVLVGACWLPVIRIQIRIRNRLARGGSIGSCRRLMQAWLVLGVLAFPMLVGLFFLMVFKPGLNWQILP